MSYPTILAPWYVVQRIRPKIEFYRTATAEVPTAAENWTEDQKQAMIFTSLQSAGRVASATAAEVRVLTSRVDLEEFHPGGLI